MPVEQRVAWRTDPHAERVPADGVWIGRRLDGAVVILSERDHLSVGADLRNVDRQRRAAEHRLRRRVHLGAYRARRPTHGHRARQEHKSPDP